MPQKTGDDLSCHGRVIRFNAIAIQFNSNILLNKCINTISNGIAHQA
jgi:hypothetical protein